ncbi:hypothetical protein AGMMS49965_02850 [Bacteroidia bacterium]|nr:hypothetical protein AGMMS49965_02850 [Bacteroidia bacterium]
MNKISVKLVLFIISCIACGCTGLVSPDGESQYQDFSPDGVPFVVADSSWNVDSVGNHRAVVLVTDAKQNAVVATLPWRRSDMRQETKRVVVKNAASGEEVKNVSLLEFSSEKGVIAFQPEAGAGNYYIYYLPYKFRTGYDDARYGKPWNDYLPAEYATDSEWEKGVKAQGTALPEAKVERIESRSRFDFFTPMGLIATGKEIQTLKEQHPGDFVVFPEDRAFPIRLTTIPARWASKAYNTGLKALAFEGYALPNEYYTWQIGLWASQKKLEKVNLQFGNFTHSSGKSVLSAEEITCFNLGGTNWDGKPVQFTVNVPQDNVQALWCGLQIPENIQGGEYKGTVTVSAENAKPQVVDVVIHVGKKLLADKGDGDLWRHARLRWLNSTIGMDDLPVAPYQKMSFDGRTVTATGKTVLVNTNGLPQSIEINGLHILEKPMEFVVSTANGKIPFTADNVTMEKKADGLIRWNASTIRDGLKFDCEASMEYDGYLRYHVKLSADKKIPVKDISLITGYTPSASEYFMGTGFKGGYRPANYTWDWKGHWDSYWTGGALAGLHVEFRGGSYHGPLINDYKPAPPAVWENAGRGRISVSGAPGGSATVVASTGSHVISSTPLDFEFALLVTPVKPVDPAKHFSERYYHSTPEGFAKAAGEGANIANIHHAQTLNPVINYPYIVREPLKEYIREQHAADRKVKLYYTIREQTTHTVEVYALKSLNHEIFTAGVGYGTPWNCEHLIDDYKPAWYTELPGQNPDAALVLTGFSRWINYYLEGLRWMFENYEIDGIYMDDVSFDREVMKRMRKIMAQYRQGALIDLHSNTGYSIGPANQYTDFFPYVDRLWFGESFRYNQMMPDEWFATFSGIPFGQMSEMLQDGGNRYLGMVYGTTARHSWTDDTHSPVPVWKVWKSFEIEKAEMLGYWNEACPVKTNHPNVKATAYVREGKTLISIGNFDDKDRQVRLSFDWAKLGLDPSKAVLEVPFVKNFQEEQTFKPDALIPVKSKEGWLLILGNK